MMAQVGGGDLVERLPHALLLDILSMLDVESLCSAAPVCRALRSSVSQVLSSLSTLDLSGFTPTTQILNRVLSNSYGLRSLTLNCHQLDYSSVSIFTKQHLEELVLLKGFHFISSIFRQIGQSCSNLRTLSLELVYGDESVFVRNCNKSLENMFKGCPHLESLSIKFHTPYNLHGRSDTIQLLLPKTLKALLLQPVTNWEATTLILMNQLGFVENLPLSIDVQPSCLMLQSLTLVLDVITDELVAAITNYLHYLTVLCLEDNPLEKLSPYNDFSNAGLQLLSSRKNLRRLSLSRSRPNVFGRVTDIGILVLTEGLRGLESIRLEGFSKVTDAGYISILQSFKNLKRFEVINGYLLSDLAFHDLSFLSGSLVEVVLISCHLLTSETAESLSLCKNLELLDLGGCKSIADRGLNSISILSKLTSLDLSGADITDSGLSALGLGRSPIVTLCLRGCRRVGDRGFKKLFKKGSVITETLSKLDLGYLPGVSDETVARIVKMCREITNLCIRSCFFVTDASIRALGLMPDIEGRRRSIKRLDIYGCSRLSSDSIELFSHPYFQGLRWLGFGKTKLHAQEGVRMMELLCKRRCMSICSYGCEMDCKDGWFLH
ncbi:hypothetical protein KFK09_016670 [Dendrobium nobile]|uniref:F-box domain-containing protein n=1 Tax=Dendrobium nobile TaxID=94219 RepID=A0A8T3B5B8_DENNO|nr:hypothetical protein KFK09_016670 [Dendrobium nobile]